MNWLPHKQLQKRWVSECGHYHRTVAHGVAGSVYDAWYHVGLPDFEHVGYSKDVEQLDRLVQFHIDHKRPQQTIYRGFVMTEDAEPTIEREIIRKDPATTTAVQRNVDLIARVCHEVNRAYCQALGDDSQPSWEQAPEWQRTSAMKGVQLHLANPDAGPQASHESWMLEKLETGWQWGPVKDPERKEHPCLVGFDQLPREQQAKDFIFRAVVHALAR